MINHQVLVNLIVESFESLGERLENFFQSRLQFLVVAIEHGKRGIEVAPPAGIIQLELPWRKCRDIFGRKEHALGVQCVEVSHKVLGGQRVVVAATGVVSLLDHID